MKAMVFAAGLGTRLKPLTDTIPKALVRVGDKTLLERVILKLTGIGITSIVVNVHHFPEMIREFLAEKKNFGITMEISDESDELLDTGGGLLKAASFLDGKEPFIVHNVDVITDLSLSDLVARHRSGASLATLAVRKRETSRYLLFDQEMRLSGWTNLSTGEIREVCPGSTKGCEPYAFSGIQVVDPGIFRLMERKGKFSIIDFYLEAGANHTIRGYADDSRYWLDVGKPKELEMAERMVRQGSM